MKSPHSHPGKYEAYFSLFIRPLPSLYQPFNENFYRMPLARGGPGADRIISSSIPTRISPWALCLISKGKLAGGHHEIRRRAPHR